MNVVQLLDRVEQQLKKAEGGRFGKKLCPLHSTSHANTKDSGGGL